MDKISCGGFYLGEGLEMEGKTLKVTDSLSLVSGDGINITWDGSTEGRDVISLEAGVATVSLYKVSNSVFDNSELIGSVFSWTEIGQEWAVIINENEITEFGTNCYGVHNGYVISGVAGEYSVEDRGVTIDFTIPSDGTYFIHDSTLSDDIMVTSIAITSTAKLVQNGEDVTDEVKETVGGTLIVNAVIADDDSSATVDKSFQTIAIAFSKGKNVVIHAKYENNDRIYLANIITVKYDLLSFQGCWWETDGDGGIDGFEVRDFYIDLYGVEYSYSYKSLSA